LRDDIHRLPTTASFFVSTRGNRMLYPTVQGVFRNLCDGAGIGADAPSRPRIHDLRHTFAIRTLIGWYHTGEDVETRLPMLSTYLGHRDPRWTCRYLSAAPELLALGGITAGGSHTREHAMSPIAPTLQAFFTDRLIKQRQVSPRTIASYRDSLRLLIGFAQDRTAKAPSRLD